MNMENQKKLRLAFGMEDDYLLSNNHFGESNYFLIIDLYDDGNIIVLEKRKNETIEEKHGDFTKFKNIIKILEDVDVFVAYRMGPNFMNIKNNSDKIPFLTRTRNLDESLRIVINNFEKLWLIKNNKN